MSVSPPRPRLPSLNALRAFEAASAPTSPGQLASHYAPKAAVRLDATALLIVSFLADAIAEIEDEVLAADVVARLESWLARRKK